MSRATGGDGTMEPSVLVVTPSDGGGMLHYASQMANALAERTAVTCVVDRGADETLFSKQVTVEPVDFPASKAELVAPSYVRALAGLIREYDPDVVHTTTLTPLLFPVPALSVGRRLVVTLHDVRQHPGEFKYTYDATARWLVATADRVIVHGQHNANEFRRKFGRPEKAVVVNHGEYAFFRNCCDAPTEYRPEVLFFGRIAEYKGVDTLLRATDRIAASVAEFTVTVAGEGDVSVPGGVSDEHLNVIEGYVPNERACELFSRCRCVVLPYRSATQTGIVPIAYSFRKPVVATRVGGLPEVVEDGETGLLVEPESPNKLAEACVRLLRDREEAERMGANADDYRRRHMDWSDIADRLLRAYCS